MQLNYGIYVIKGPVVGGMWLRQSAAENFDAFIILLGIVNLLGNLDIVTM